MSLGTGANSRSVTLSEEVVTFPPEGPLEEQRIQRILDYLGSNLRSSVKQVLDTTDAR